MEVLSCSHWRLDFCLKDRGKDDCKNFKAAFLQSQNKLSDPHKSRFGHSPDPQPTILIVLSELVEYFTVLRITDFNAEAKTISDLELS